MRADFVKLSFKLGHNLRKNFSTWSVFRLVIAQIQPLVLTFFNMISIDSLLALSFAFSLDNIMFYHWIFSFVFFFAKIKIRWNANSAYFYILLYLIVAALDNVLLFFFTAYLNIIFQDKSIEPFRKSPRKKMFLLCHYYAFINMWKITARNTSTNLTLYMAISWNVNFLEEDGLWN